MNPILLAFYKVYLLVIAPLFWVSNRLTVRHILPDSIARSLEHLRMFLLRAQGLRAGAGVFIRTNFWCSNPRNLRLGTRGTIGINCQFYSFEKITIGNDFLIGSDVLIHTAEHVFKDPELPIIEQGSHYRPVVIGDNVYIGSRAIILPGVTIGSNLIIAAGAVVTTSLPSGYIYGGNPAKQIKPLN